MERRLAAILAADVVGYTRLMEKAEVEVFARLHSYQKDLFEPEIAAHRGRVFKLMGDGLLAEFGSVVDATECAVALQRNLADREAPTASERRIVLRIGINLGDVIVEQEDRYGSDVNIAARLQQLAEPGGIVVSEAVVNHVRNKVALTFAPMGEQRLRNLDEPVTAFRVITGGEPRVDGTAARTNPEAVLQRPAVAILPFVNLSGDPAQEYLADGITEDLITALAQWRWFPVIARNSVFAYKARAVDATQVGRELKARYVLTGSLRRAGERLRVNAQLVDGHNGHNLWTQSYDRRLGDIFELQDELTRAIVVALEPQIEQAEQRRAARKRPESLDAWDLSLRALAQIRRGTTQALANAKQLLAQAIEMDGSSSYAQSLLALTEFHGALAGWTSDPAGALEDTLSAAESAVSLDDSDWLAHALRGIAVLWVRRAYGRAIDEEELALSLNPSASLAYHFLGCALTFDGQPAAALPKLAAVLDIDPRFSLLPVTLADLGLAKLLVGEFEAALDFIERALAEQAYNVRAWQRKTVALAQLGRIEEAEAALGQLLKLQPSFSPAYLMTTYPFRNSDHSALMLEGLRRAGWRA